MKHIINFPKELSYFSLKFYPNLIIVRTFSKAFGLAAVRLGYIVSQSCNIDSLYKVKPLADINLFALKFGEFLLDNNNIVLEYVQTVNESKLLIEETLKELNIECIIGQANFMHLRLPEKYDLNIIYQNMKKQGYLFRVNGKRSTSNARGMYTYYSWSLRPNA